MSFTAAIDHIIDEVEGLTPARDTSQGFVYLRGLTSQSLDESLGVPRVFRLDLVSPPTDDGEAGATQRRLRAGLALTLQYPAEEDDDLAMRVRAEDVGQLARRLPFIGSGSAAATAGLLSIPPIGTPRNAAVTDGERVLARRVVVPFDIVYTD